jgi:hypothetical protein
VRIFSPVLPLALAVTLAAALAGCGTGGAAPRSSPASSPPAPTPAARAELAARAAAAQDQVAVSFYALRPPGGAEDRTVMVVRAADGGWRVDIAGGALGGTTDISIIGTASGLFQCGPDGCVQVDELTPEVDPRVHHVFTDWLDVLTDRSAAVSVSAAAPPDGVTGECFGVEPSAASLVPPLDAGVYCYEVDGTLTGAELELGTLTLTGSGEAAPPTVDLPGPVVAAEPLPTASPTPSPTPSPSPTRTP